MTTPKPMTPNMELSFASGRVLVRIDPMPDGTASDCASLLLVRPGKTNVRLEYCKTPEMIELAGHIEGAIRSAEAAAVERERQIILAEFPFDAEWCAKHAEHDYLCEMDHKDEMDVADFGTWLRARKGDA